MISDGNILRLLYFLFFILSSWSSIPCPSFNHTLANFENKNKWIFWMFSAASQIAEAELFFGALYLYSLVRVARLLSPLSVFKFCFSHVTEPAPGFLAFLDGRRGWGGVLYIFQFFILSRTKRGGWDGCHPVYLSYRCKKSIV